jgi:hypothetical protein
VSWINTGALWRLVQSVMSIWGSGWSATASRWTGPDTRGDDMKPHDAMQSALDEGFGQVAM